MVKTDESPEYYLNQIIEAGTELKDNWNNLSEVERHAVWWKIHSGKALLFKLLKKDRIDDSSSD